MRKTMRFTAILLMMAVVLGGCGNSGISQDEYDKVVAERDELQKQTEKEENPAINFFEEIEGVTVLESGDSRKKALILTCYIKLYAESEEVSEMANSVGERIRNAQDEEWFDYDYILVDFWSESTGRIVSMTIDSNNLSEPMQINEWYGGEGETQEQGGLENSGKDGNEQTTKEEKIIYQDESVIITYKGLTGEESKYKINFMIENLSEKTLSVQLRETSINGFMVEPMCSIEIAPGKKSIDSAIIWGEDAENCPMSSVENIETRFHIFNDDDWTDRYDTESIVILDSES